MNTTETGSLRNAICFLDFEMECKVINLNECIRMAENVGILRTFQYIHTYTQGIFSACIFKSKTVQQ